VLGIAACLAVSTVPCTAAETFCISKLASLSVLDAEGGEVLGIAENDSEDSEGGEMKGRNCFSSLSLTAVLEISSLVATDFFSITSPCSK
jgi:hypothetical protein